MYVHSWVALPRCAKNRMRAIALPSLTKIVGADTIQVVVPDVLWLLHIAATIFDTLSIALPHDMIDGTIIGTIREDIILR